VVVEAHGEDSRGLGTAVAVVSTQLRARGAETEVEVVTELDLTGKAARYGTAVVSEVADKLLDQFSSCLARRLTGGTDGALLRDAAAPAVDPAGPGGSVDAVPPPPVQPRRARRSAAGKASLPLPRPAAATAVRRYAPAVAGAVVLVWLGLRLVRRVS
jgi:hypothetical protein